MRTPITVKKMNNKQINQNQENMSSSDNELSSVVDRILRAEESVYVGTLTADQLKMTGFVALWEPEDEWWQKLEYVDIYYLPKGGVEYVFNGDNSDTYICHDNVRQVLMTILEVLGRGE
jgi:hypothetical protein